MSSKAAKRRKVRAGKKAHRQMKKPKREGAIISFSGGRAGNVVYAPSR